ncbi:phage/plasmid replication domain-containing protein [Carboxylicivirga sp. RSCT41]|uniref:phage/plasmid replication domain-containing protein n=1 Tax=Carboxylicivirga agarovorans TaxID=3417570 RepID=UPI003D355350
MIDTIVLRIHNINQYPEAIDALIKEGEGEYYSTIDNPHNKEVVDCDTGEISNAPHLQIRQIYYSDTDKTYTLYRNKTLTSSHYYLGYRISLDKDFVEFNFSIPKYLYGTNLKQFVPHKEEGQNYKDGELDSFEFNMNITYERLIQFIRDFIKKWFKGEIISELDVEIVRLDICYNQIFNTKEDALKYLEYQKKIKKKYLKATSKNKTDWGTSIFLQTDRYAAKIYHKGSEYSSKDGERKHHLQVNKKLGKEQFPIQSKYDKDFGHMLSEGLQDYSDRILRYEISYKNAYMSALYKKFLFAPSCPIFKQLERDFKTVKALQRKIDTAREKTTKITAIKYDQFELEAFENQLRDLPKLVKSNSKLYESILNKRNSFRLQITPQEKDENAFLEYCGKDEKGKLMIPKTALFSKELLDEMFKVFVDFKDQFRIESLEKFTDVTKRVINYNRDVEKFNKDIPADSKLRKKRINQTYINSILLHLQSYSFDELVDNKIISRRTKYYYIKALEAIGLSKNHLAVDSIDISKSEEFDIYHIDNKKVLNQILISKN